MSWDIVLFNSKQKIDSIEELDETLLEPTDFCAALKDHFKQIHKDRDRLEIKGADFTIDYFADDEYVSNKMLSLHGENGLFELAILAKECGWQLFDTGLGEMIDLDYPARNGYDNFQNYLQHVLNQ